MNPDTIGVSHICDIGMGGRGGRQKMVKPVEQLSFLFMKLGHPAWRKKDQNTTVSGIFVRCALDNPNIQFIKIANFFFQTWICAQRALPFAQSRMRSWAVHTL